MSDWNSEQYIKFEKERTQPSVDLISRIETEPETALDIGCGPGNSTSKLHNAFPTADISGIDSSDDMLKKAAALHPELKFKKCVIPDELDNIGKFDLIFSNACLHWIPHHENLLPQIMEKLNGNGVFAVQMPLVQNADFYRLLYKMIDCKKWEKLQSVSNFHNLSPNETYDILAKTAHSVEMWETVYYHVVPSHSAVIEWYKGSGLRPYLDLLTEEECKEFLKELLEKIGETYPVQSDGNVILKMPRLFFIAKK